MDYPGFCSGAYLIQNQSADCQRCVNLYPQPDETGGGKNKIYLLSTPGLQRFADLTSISGTGGSRGTYYASNNRFFAVVGSFLIELGSTGTILGSYALPNETGLGPVSMTDNGQDMMIATGPNGYWFHFASTGTINDIAIAVPGTGWAVGDQFIISGGMSGIGTVTAETGGVPTGIAISAIGTGYSNGTSGTSAQLPSVGVGLTVAITVLAANTLTQITDAVFEGAVGCGFIDGFIVFNQPNSQIFWKTNLYSTVIDPLGFASAEGNPDNLIFLLCDHREIWLFGDISTEVWYDSGGANFPFSFIQGAYISHGIAAPFSAVRLDNTTFWLGNDEFGHGVAYRANGYAPVRISTFAMEQAWQRYPTLTDAVAYTYQQDGHSFYVLNFPSGDATWVFDAATGLWHERAYLGTLTFNDGQLHRGRPNTHSFAFGKHLVGDWETGFLYQMDPQFFDDDGREIQRLRSAPYLDQELKRIFYSQFQLDMEVGQGNPGSGDDTTAISNAIGEIRMPWSGSLSPTFTGIRWGGFALIGSLPADAIIQGIYPVMVASATYDSVDSYFEHGTALNISNPVSGTKFVTPITPQNATFASTELFGPSLGTDISVLTSQEMVVIFNMSLDETNHPDIANVTACGYAIYYTSANPVIDPQVPPPFSVPPGQGLAWALPATLLDVLPSPPQMAFRILNSTLTSAGLCTLNYETIGGGPNPKAGDFVVICNTTNATGLINNTYGVFVPHSYAIASSTGGAAGTIAITGVPSASTDWPTQDEPIAAVGVQTTGIAFGAAAVSTIIPGNHEPKDPQINLRWSDDGGYTWSNYSSISMGESGQYRKRVIWRRLGNGRQRVFEISTGQNFVPLNIYNAYLELTAGSS